MIWTGFLAARLVFFADPEREGGRGRMNVGLMTSIPIILNRAFLFMINERLKVDNQLLVYAHRHHPELSNVYVFESKYADKFYVSNRLIIPKYVSLRKMVIEPDLFSLT